MKNSKQTRKFTALMSGASIVALGMMVMSAPVHAQTAAPAAATDNSTVVVVTGQRAALKSAQNIKKNSDQVVDSIVASDIGKLPDRSVTEVLQRIPGISISHSNTDIAGNTDPEHFTPEGNAVTIRGMTYVLSEINGRDAFSANGGRGLSFQDVPPELMAAVDVYKNPDASQIEGGISGLVDLRTSMPFDYKGLKMSASIGGTYSELAGGSLKPQESFLVSDRWHTSIGDIGVLADVSHSEITTRTDGTEAYPYFPRIAGIDALNGQTANEEWISAGGDSSWRTEVTDRKRDGDYLALQWRPNDQIDTSLTFFRSAYKYHWDEDAIFSQVSPYNIEPQAGTAFTTQNNIVTGGTEVDPTDGGLPFDDDVRSADQTSATTDVSWKTTWRANDKLTFRSDLQYVYATAHSDDYTVATGVNQPYETFNIPTNGGIPTSSVDAAYLSNPANYYWAFTMDGQSRNIGKEWAWKGDAEYEFSEGFFKSLDVGVRLNDRSAYNELSEPGSGYNWAAVSQTWQVGQGQGQLPTLAYLSEFPAATKVFAFNNFLNGAIAAPPSVIFPANSLANTASFIQLHQFSVEDCLQNPINTVANCPTFTAASFANSLSQGGINTQSEKTYATYAEVHFGQDTGAVPFDGTFGVRIVNTVDEAQGYETLSAFDAATATSLTGSFVSFNGVATPSSARNDYTDVLPSLNLRFKFNSQLQARIALSEGMTRPDFSQLQDFTSLSTGVGDAPGSTTSGVQTFTGTANGNPNLKPVKSNNLDLTLEWYFAPTGSLTAALFHKDLSDVVINEVYSIPETDTAGQTENFTATGPINGAKGTVNGFEIAYQQYFDNLPEVLKGFGMQANATFIDSQRKLYNPVTSPYCDASNSQTALLNEDLNGCDTDGRSFGNLPLQNLSRYAFNIAALYDRGPVSARLAYSWRSKYLMGVNVNPVEGSDGLNTDTTSASYGQENVDYALPLYAANYGQLDGGIFYKINDHVTAGVEGQNLTDSTYKELMEQHIGMMPFAWYKSGRSYSIQLRVTY